MVSSTQSVRGGSQRAKNAKRNMASGFVYKMLNVFAPFLIRTAIIYCLGEQYAGITGLFSSILQVLNLAELGFSLAIIYHMYKPLSEGRIDIVNALLNYYKRVYRTIGIIILFGGIIVMPWIDKLINGSWPESINIYILYFLFLLDSVVSYFLFAYMDSLLNALQRLDLSNIALLIARLVRYITQLIAIIVLKNIYLYAVLAIMTSILANFLVAFFAHKKYPEYRAVGEISPQMKRSVKKHVSGVMICKIGDVARNSLDNIILSALFGLTVVAIYGNYYTIFSAIYAVLLMITSSMQAGVGDSIATESIEKNYRDFKTLSFVFSWIICFCCVCMIGMYQSFMNLWVGPEMILSNLNMVLFVVYFYVLNMNNMRNLYFSGNGLWWKAKAGFILEAALNLVLNILLGMWLGVTGIIIATIITIFLFNFILRTNLLFKEYFKKSAREFYQKNLSYFLASAALCAIGFITCMNIRVDGVPGLFLKGVVCCVLGASFVAPFIKTREFRSLIKFMRRR